jgi:hypothetical protein
LSLPTFARSALRDCLLNVIKRARAFPVAALTLLFLASCSDKTPTAVPARAAGPSLAYVVALDAAAEWRVVDLGANTETVIARLPQSPEPVFWDSAEPDVYYRAGGKIWRLRWSLPHGQPAAVSALPPASGQLTAFWVDSANGRLRAIEMRRRELGKLPDGTPERTEPPDATPYLCLVWELTPEGNWGEIGRYNTSWEVDGSLGYAVADELRRERGWSVASLRARGGCASELCDTEVPEATLKLLPPVAADDVPEKYRLLKIPGVESSFVFGVRLADRWHPTLPVFWGPTRGPPQRLAVGGTGAISLTVNDDYLLVANEDTGSDPMVIDARTGKVIWQNKGGFATWLPHKAK